MLIGLHSVSDGRDHSRPHVSAPREQLPLIEQPGTTGAARSGNDAARFACTEPQLLASKFHQLPGDAAQQLGATPYRAQLPGKAEPRNRYFNQIAGC